MVDDEIAGRLVEKSVAALKTTLFIGAKAQLPKRVTGAPAFLVVSCYQGRDPVRTHDRGTQTAYARPRLQVVAHGDEPGAVWALAMAAYEALPLDDDAAGGAAVGGVWYLRITPLQDPWEMGLDDAGRLMVGFNLETEKRPS